MLTNLNFSNQRYASRTNFAENLVKKYTRLARAEAHCISILFDRGNPDRRCELFGGTHTTEFLIAKMISNSGIANQFCMTVDSLPPEQFIGLFEQFFFEYDLTSRAQGMRRYVSYPLCGSANSDGSFTDKTLYCFPNCSFKVAPFLDKQNGWQYRGDYQIYPCPCPSSISFREFPKTKEGIIMSLLGILALRFWALYGSQFSVEDVCDRIYNNEFITEPCWDLRDANDEFGRRKLVCLNNLPEAFVRTVPTESHLQRYNMADNGAIDEQHPFCFDNILYPPGRDGYATFSNQEGTAFIPLSFYRYGDSPHPVTFPISPISHFPLYNKDRIEQSKRVYLCEYPRFAEDNVNSPIPVISFINGEWGLQFTDFDPLEGKEVTYLEMRDADDQDSERAHRTMLKAFAMTQKAGNRNFITSCIESGQEIPYRKLLTESIERGYLRDVISVDVGNTFEECLSWSKGTGKKETIFGRAIQAGRINLFSAARGTGKTELMLMLATVGASGMSLDQSFFKYNLPGPCKTLYIQSEMDVETDLRGNRLTGIESYIRKNVVTDQGNPTDSIIFYTKKASLIEIKEQCDVLKKIAKHDSDHQWQWRVVIDSVKTEMGEALNSSEIYKNRVMPWLDFMRKKGIEVDILNHRPKDAKSSSGTGSIEDLADEIFYVEIDAETKKKSTTSSNSCVDAITIAPDKRRLLPGNLGVPAHVRWETDADQSILRIESWYDDEPMPTRQQQTTAMEVIASVNHDEDGSTNIPKSENSSDLPRLPKTWNELKALPENEQRNALFELMNNYGSNDKIVQALNMPKGRSSIKRLKTNLGVNNDSLMEYLRNKGK